MNNRTQLNARPLATGLGTASTNWQKSPAMSGGSSSTTTGGVSQMSRQVPNALNEDEEYDEVLRQTVETVQRSRKKIAETEKVGEASVQRLYEQSDQLASIEDNLDKSKFSLDDAKEEVKRYKRPFMCGFGLFLKPFRSRQRRAMKEQRQKEIMEAETAQMERREERRRQEAELRRQLAENEQQSFNGVRMRATRPKDPRAEAEDVIDKELDKIGKSARNLTAMASAMNEEISSQNERLDRMDKKALHLTIEANTQTRMISK